MPFTRISKRHSFLLKLWCFIGVFVQNSECFIFFPRGGSFGYLAAVALPIDLPNRNVYVAFNFEANYGLPSNDSYNEWIDRWNLNQAFLGVGNNVTTINGRHSQKRSLPYNRCAFYSAFIGYVKHFEMNGTACLLRTICEVTESTLDENNGLLGTIFKILFMPTTSSPEIASNISNEIYEAEYNGRNAKCLQYKPFCPQGILDLASIFL